MVTGLGFTSLFEENPGQNLRSVRCGNRGESLDRWVGIYPHQCVSNASGSPAQGEPTEEGRTGMTGPMSGDSVGPGLFHFGLFSDQETASANAARVDRWHQERRALAAHGVPSGVWQGRMWRSSI